MKKDTLTEKQFWAMSSLAVLSPLLRLLPGLPCRFAGSGAWLSCLMAMLPLAGFALLCHIVRIRGAIGAQLSQFGFGGRIVCWVLSLWFWLYGGILLRSGAERFLAAMRVFQTWLPYAILLMLLAVPAAAHGAKPLFRAAEIFLPILTAALLLALAASFGQTEWKLLTELPSASRLARGVVPLWNIGGGMLFYGAFFQTEAPGLKASLKWLLRLCLTAAALCAVAAGTLGAAVTTQLSHPFFVLLRNLSLSPAIERFEALIAGMWVLPDFAMLSLLLLLGGETAGLALQKPSVWYVGVGAAGMLLTAAILGKTAFRLAFWSEHVIPIATLILTIGITLVLLFGNPQKR